MSKDKHLLIFFFNFIAESGSKIQLNDLYKQR